MTLELPDLPYAYEALEPLISAAALRTHHGKHHRAYVDKVNTLVRDTDLAGAALEAIVAESARRVISDPAMRPLFKNAAQAWNHALLEIPSPEGRKGGARRARRTDQIHIRR